MPADSDAPGGDRLISSTANPRVKQLLALRRRRMRDETGLTLVDGIEELSLAIAAGVRPRTVFVSTDLQTSDEANAVVARARDLDAEIVQLTPGRVRPRRLPRGPGRGPGHRANSANAAGRPGGAGEPVAARLPGHREAGQPRGHAANGRRSRRGCGDRHGPRHRRRQSQRHPRVEGDGVRRARRDGDDRSHAELAGVTEHSTGGHHSGHGPGLHRHRLHRGSRRRGRVGKVRSQRRGPCRSQRSRPYSHAGKGKLTERRSISSHRDL